MHKVLEINPTNKKALELTAGGYTHGQEMANPEQKTGPENRKDQELQPKSGNGTENSNSGESIIERTNSRTKTKIGLWVLTGVLSVGLLIILLLFGSDLNENHQIPEIPTVVLNATVSIINTELVKSTRVLPPTWTNVPSSAVERVLKPSSTPIPTQTFYVVPSFTPSQTPTSTSTATVYNPTSVIVIVTATNVPVLEEPTAESTRAIRATRTTRPQDPVQMTCSVSPSIVSVGYGGDLHVSASLSQNGKYIWSGALLAEWDDGSHSGHCSNSSGGVGPLSCIGHYWPLPRDRTVIVNVGLNDRDGGRYNCQTSYSSH